MASPARLATASAAPRPDRSNGRLCIPIPSIPRHPVTRARRPGKGHDRQALTVRRTTPVEPADIVEAGHRGWPIGRKDTLTVPEVLGRVTEAARALGLPLVTQAFVAGGGGSASRGRQILISYVWALHLPAAIAAAAPSPPDCELRDPVTLDFTRELMNLALGYVWNELPERYLPDLEAAAAEGLPTPTADDRARFDALIAFIAAQPADTTPGLLEKNIARAKLLPGTGKYECYGILQGLAGSGVMPNAFIPPSLKRHIPRAEVTPPTAASGGAARSDIVLPLAAWRGNLGIDRACLDRLFPRIA